MTEMKTIQFPNDAEPREIVDAKAREELKEKLSNSALTEAISIALAQAKESGEFDGETGVGIANIKRTATDGLVDTYTVTFTDGSATSFSLTNGADGKDGNDGFSPLFAVTAIEGGHKVTVTDANGETSFVVMDGSKGENGSDYVLTDTDKTEIAEQAAALIDTTLASIIGTGVLE